MGENPGIHAKEAINQTIALILGGGKGKRLYPLTRSRSKPAVPFAGNYRIIDIPISNCIHSGINKIFVLTQYNSASLNRHIAQTYKFDIFHDGFVEILAAEETPHNTLSGFSHGTAQAVRDGWRHLESDHNVSHILILGGDQLYQMDFQELYIKHLEKNAEVTLGVLPIERKHARRFGIVEIQEDDSITDFLEKPVPETIKDSWNVGETREGQPHRIYASMNMYLFNREVLFEILEKHPHMKDFGKEIIPHIIHENRVFASVHEGYWEDIGTLKSFHSANLALTQDLPGLNVYNKKFHFFSHPRFLAPSKIQQTEIDRSIISDGSILNKSRIYQSVIGVRSVVRSGTLIENSIIMGNDYYETLEEETHIVNETTPPLGIGSNCIIRNAIIDKNCRIGNNVRIENLDEKEDGHYDNYSISGDLIVIPKNSILTDNTVI